MTFLREEIKENLKLSEKQDQKIMTTICNKADISFFNKKNILKLMEGVILGCGVLFLASILINAASHIGLAESNDTNSELLAVVLLEIYIAIKYGWRMVPGCLAIIIINTTISIQFGMSFGESITNAILAYTIVFLFTEKINSEF